MRCNNFTQYLNPKIASFKCSPFNELDESEYNYSFRGIEKTSFRKFIIFLIAILILVAADIAGQTTFTANNTGNWTTLPWIKSGPSAATYPGQPGFESEVHHVVIFGAGITVTLNVNITSSVRNITLSAGTLDISSNTLTMTGNLSGAGGLSFTSGTLNIAGDNVMIGPFNAGTGTMNFNGTGGQTIRGTTYYNLVVSGSGTKVLQAATGINRNLSIAGTSTLQTNQFQITGNATGTFTMASGTNLLIGNTVSGINVSFPTNFTSPNISLSPNSTVSYQANTSQTISSVPVYGHLTTATSGIKTLDGNTVIAGNLIIGIGTTLDLSSNNYIITLSGSWISYGNFNENQGKVTFNGTSTQSIINALTGSETYYDLEFNTVGPVIATCNLAVTNILSLTNGVILMPGKTLLLGAGAANPGTLSHTSGWVYGSFSRWAAPAQSGNDLVFPVGDNNYDRTMTLNFPEISTAGVISVNFVGTPPSTSGLPLVEDIYIFNLLFTEGYWNLTRDLTFNYNGTFNLSVVPSGFTSYTIDGNTRILSRVTGMDWLLNGIHVPGTPALLRRNGLTTFTNEYAAAFPEICNSALINCPGDVLVNNQPGACGNTVSWVPPVISPKCIGDTITSNYKPGDYFDVGTHQIVYYLRNGAVKKDSCKFNVIVNDNEAPVVLCKDATLYIGPLGTASLNISDIDNGSADNCSLVLVPARTVFTCSDAGLTIPVSLTGTDPSGNSASCTAMVAVLDTTRPVINTKTFTLILDATGNGTLLPSDVDNGTFDNCTAVSLAVFPNTFSCANLGLNAVTFTARDAYGNTAISTVQITVQSTLTINSTSLSSCDVAGPYALYQSDVTGGDGNYSYFWDGLDDSVDPFIAFTGTFPFIIFSNTSTAEMPFFNNLMPDGLYTIRLIVTDGNSCRDTMDMLIIKSGLMFNNITIRYSAACEGSTERYTVKYDAAATYNWGVENGTIITSPLDTNSVEVLWNTGVTRGVIISTASKINILGEPCQSMVVDTVTINPLPLPVFNNPSTEVCFNSVVTYTLTQPYSDYTWIVTGGSITAGGTGSNFVTVRWGPGPAGIVAVSVSSGAGCSNAIFINISIYNVSGSVTSLKNVTCNGYTDGEVTVTATSGTGKPPYQYSLDGGPFQLSGTFTGLGPGVHNVIIRDNLSCTFNVNFTITQPPLITATVSKVDIACNGQSTGSISAAGSGGTPPLTYSLDGGAFVSSGIFNGLPAGPHTLIVRDANMCVFSQNINLIEPPLLTGTATVTSPIPCNGGTATVTLAGSGGTAPLSFTFNGVTNATGVFSGVTAGNGYAWSITDANACGPVTGTLNVTQPLPISGSASVTTAILCNGGTAIVTITGTGGSAPLFYTFNGLTNGTGIFIGVPAGTGYTWSITDLNGCGPVAGTLDITEPSVITGSASVTAPVLCSGGNATVTIIGGGGTPPLSYTFNGVTNSTGIFSGIPAGTGYIWSITDANNCSVVTDLIDVTEPALLAGSASVISPVICNGGTATITMTGSGGTAPYSYTFNGVTNSSGIFIGIPAGTGYSWSITDANLCGPVTGTLDVTQPALLTGSASVTSPATCNGGMATVTLAANGGTPPYSFTFNGVTNATGVFNNITAGTAYIWSITDANLCGPSTGTLDVTEPSILTGAASVTGAILCNGGTSTVTLTGGGGTAPLSFTFNGITNATGIFSGVTAGSGYAWSITDANMCGPVTGTLDVTEPPALTGSASVTTPIQCAGGTATITLTGNGGTPPLSYNFNGVTNATGIFSGVTAGSGYAWSITDANMCGPVNGNLDVTESSALSGSITAQVNVSTFGGNDGSVTVEGSGGTVPYQYRLNTGPYQPSGTFLSLSAGSYTVTVQDASLCTFDVPVTITQPAGPLSGAITVQADVLCFGGSTGTVTVTGIEGIPPYEYSLNAGPYQASGTFGSLSAGSYIITVRDAIMDTFVIPVTISEPSALSVTTTQVDVICFGSATGSSTATPGGGTGPYSYSWNTIPVQTTATATGLAAATYTVTVTDANGCVVTADVTITQPAEDITITFTQVNVICAGGSTGSASATVTGGNAPYSYSWNTTPAQVTPAVSGLSAGTYTLTITDFTGCIKTGTVTITEPGALSLEATSGNAKCPDSNEGIINLTISGGTSPFNIIWSDGNNNPNRTNLLPGTYSVVVTDQNGCASSLDVTVGFDGSFDCVAIPKVITPNGDGKNDTWIIRNIDLYPDAEVLIFTRWGKLIFRTKNLLANPWNGTYSNGELVPTDSYHYILYLNDGSGLRSGVISVIR